MITFLKLNVCFIEIGLYVGLIDLFDQSDEHFTLIVKRSSVELTCFCTQHILAALNTLFVWQNLVPPKYLKYMNK